MKIKRVLLVSPPDTRPPDLLTDKIRIGMVAPLGLAYIAAVLEQQGIEVKILDCVGTEPSAYPNGDTRYGLTDAQIAAEIGSYAPDMVGVSCLFSNKAFDAHNVCRIAKLVNPNIITVMGGAHPSALPEETLKDRNVDYVAVGEGEFVIRDLVRDVKMHLAASNEHLGSLTVTTPNLDEYPLPARHLLPMSKYTMGESPHSGLKRTPVLTMTTSRGCPGQCSFCAIKTMWGDSYRARSAENVLAEIEHLITVYGARELHIEDDSFTANKKRAMSILQGIIDRKYDLTINSPSGLAVYSMDEQLIDKMREAGFYSLSFAIESGSQEVLKLMHKKVDHDKAKRLIKYARSLDMKTKAFYILGYPGETKDTMRQTVDMAYQLGADWSLFFPATPLPGTPMLETCKQNGWLADPDLDYRYYFHKANIRTPDFDPYFVQSFREAANRHVNFENNVNMEEGKFERAAEDFGEVVKHYPNLDFAQKALKEAQCKLD